MKKLLRTNDKIIEVFGAYDANLKELERLCGAVLRLEDGKLIS